MPYQKPRPYTAYMIPKVSPPESPVNIPRKIPLALAPFSFLSYLSISLLCPPNATTVLTAASTSSAIAPACPYASISFSAIEVWTLAAIPPKIAIKGITGEDDQGEVPPIHKGHDDGEDE